MTVARKVASIAAFAVILGFVAMMAISIGNQRATLIAHGQQSFLHMTQLLAANVAGGLRWQKAVAVEKAYIDFATMSQHRDHAATVNIANAQGRLEGINWSSGISSPNQFRPNKVVRALVDFWFRLGISRISLRM